MKTCKHCNSSHNSISDFCSKSCSRAYSGSKSKGSKKPRSKHDPIKKECPSCKEEFEVLYNKRNQIACSRTCSMKLRGGWNNHDMVDWSSIHLKAYEKGSNYVAGGTTDWLNYKDIKVQGTYELRACEILDELKEQRKIKDWSYSTKRVQYDHEGKNRTYIIDFTIEDIDGSERYIEIKGREVELDKIKWNAARQQGLNLEVWRYEDLFH